MQITHGWAVTLVVVLAAAATLGSSAIPGKDRAFYIGRIDCFKRCDFVAAGWPFPYLVDHPGISLAGSVSLVEGLPDVDIFWFGAPAAAYSFWLLLSSHLISSPLLSSPLLLLLLLLLFG